MQTASRGLLGTDPELCLDFTDVVDWRTSDHAKDTVNSYAKLLEWSRKHGILDSKQEATLNRSTPKEESARVLASAVRLREAIYRIFSTVAHEGKSDARDLLVLNEYLARGLGRVRVAERERSFDWMWGGDSPDTMLYPIASSAAGLLTSEDLGRVRECANEEEGCGSLFLDHSKSQTKKWCSMESCGNRMKFKTYYDRHLRKAGRTV
jgi:predicted RNA-binding Zn ribbon-like protein